MYTNPKTEDKMREIRRVKMNEQTWYMTADVEDIIGRADQVAAVVA